MIDDSSSPADDLLAEVLRTPVEQQEQRLEALCAASPELADDLRRRFALLAELGVPPVDPGEPFPERVGDFRLLERLGAGGMGVVYRAEQESLGREVALKLIRPEQMFFPGARERFQREVEAVARLQHPGIVPVYTVGAEGELPWFAMELMRGATLAEVLRLVADRAPESLSGLELLEGACSLAGVAATVDAERRFAGGYVNTCCEIGRQIAEALAHAHERGILHRDVKPSNVVLTADGRAMLLDFGLTSSAEGDRITRTGSAVGTLHYMSPEQLAGREVNACADVYSLGVSLYELLALQAPYQGESRAEIERRIRAGNPDSLRARNRRVSMEVEQVCRKAMDPDPVRRYPTAAAFAADLRNLLDRRPVTARPPGFLLRLRRWTQRQPGVAAGLAGAFLLAAGIPTALGWQQIGHNRDLLDSLAREQKASAEARHERDLARQRAAQYEEMTDFLVELFEDAEPEVGGDGVVTAAALLETGVEKIRTELLDQPRTRAAMLTSLSRVHFFLGQNEEALRLAQESVAQLEALPERDTELESRALHALGTVLSVAGDSEEADRVMTQALDLAEAMPEPDLGWVFSLLLARGSFRSNALRFEEAEQDFHRLLASPELERLPAEDRAYILDVGSFFTNRAQHKPLDERQGAFAEAEPLLREAVRLLAGEPEAPLRRLGTATMALGLNVKHQGRLLEAAELYAEAREALVQVQGEDSRYLGFCLINEAGVNESLGRHERAVERSREGVEILAAQMPAEHPGMILVRGNLAGSLYRAGHHEEAEALYGEIIPLQEKRFGEKHPAVPASYLNLARCRLVRKDFDGALAALDRAGELLELQRGAGHPELWMVEAGRVELALARQQPDEAAAALARAEALLGDDEGYAVARQNMQLRRGRMLLSQADPEGALEVFASCAAFFAEKSPHSLDLRNAWLGQLEALVALERNSDAGDLLEQMVADVEGRVAPDSPLASTLARLGQDLERD